MNVKFTLWIRLLLGLIALTQFVVRGDTSLRTKSPVWDEQMHIDYGVNFLVRGPVFDPADHPYPVTAMLVAPLVWFSDPVRMGENNDGPLLIEAPQNLYPARRANLWLGALGLLLFALFVGYAVDGLVGVLVLILGSLDPGWLAQARFVTTDIGFSLGFFCAAVALLHHRQGNNWAPVIGAGVATGFAVLCKFSGWLLIPFGFIYMLIPDRSHSELRLKKALVHSVKVSAVMACVAVVTCVFVFSLPALAGLSGVTDGVQHWWQGVGNFFEVRADHRGAFLSGEFYERGSFLYFPTLFVTKTPFLFLMVFGLVLGTPRLRASLRPYRAFLVIPILYLLVAVGSRINLGYRHLLPVLPFLWFALALGLARVIRAYHHGISAVCVFFLLLAMEVVAVHPNYLPFTNEVFGGEDAAHEIAVDSASDWGQDLPALAQYLKGTPDLGVVHLAYFGRANPSLYGISYVWRPCGALGFPRPAGVRQASCTASADTLAISSTCLQGGAGARLGGGLTERDDCYAWLRSRRPDLVLNGSILIYRSLRGPNQP